MLFRLSYLSTLSPYLPHSRSTCAPAFHLIRLLRCPTLHRPSLNIYTVNDLLSRKGWHLNALQHPAALHICFTAAHDEAVADKLVQVRKRQKGGLGGRKGKEGGEKKLMPPP